MANQHEEYGKGGTDQLTNMTEYGNGEGGTQSPPFQTAVDPEQLRNVQDSERYPVRKTRLRYKKYIFSFLGVESSEYNIERRKILN